MHPKFIIVSQPGKVKGLLRMGMVSNHRDLVEGYEKVHGGGWWMRDDEKKEIVLYGSSGDFGSPDFRFLDMIPEELKDYSFYFTPYQGLPGNPLDTSGIEWV